MSSRDHQKGFRYPLAVKKAVIAEVARGEKTRHQIAKDWGISYWTLRNWVGARKDVYKERRQREMFYDKAIEMHWEGASYRAISRRTGVPVSTIWDWVRKSDK